MLTPEELAALESLLTRARASAQRGKWVQTPLAPGDVAQIRPGASPHWATSLVLITKAPAHGRVRGIILRPHRSGCPEAAEHFSPPEIARIGHAPFFQPPAEIRSHTYCPDCPADPHARPGPQYAQEAAWWNDYMRLLRVESAGYSNQGGRRTGNLSKKPPARETQQCTSDPPTRYRAEPQ